ncbi:MAG TPA: hypothetical protein VN667_17935 [Burkholderiales bacterium]|nr:hypothetical protein [Burkholderiales bacterium]
MLGWTWEEAEQMDFVRLPHIFRQFEITPPLHVLVGQIARYIGYDWDAPADLPAGYAPAPEMGAGNLLDAFSTPASDNLTGNPA